MDYQKIYTRFIEDRRSKNPASEWYFETHHILPRSLGGLDEPENLIDLTAEDHLFAHLLLAKIHGGKMWNAVHAMLRLTRGQRKFGMRPIFGIARRKVAQYHRELFSGPESPQADKAVHELRHHDGRSVSGNRFELEAITGIPRQQISALLLGEKKTNRGWYCVAHNPMGKTATELTSEGIRSKQVFDLYHYDGREWRGTRWEFAKEFGAQLVFQTEGGSVLGWYKSKQDAAAHWDKKREKAIRVSSARGSISGSANPNADTNVYRWRIIATGEEVLATKIEIKSKFGLKSSSICSLFSGRQKQTSGIALAA